MRAPRLVLLARAALVAVLGVGLDAAAAGAQPTPGPAPAEAAASDISPGGSSSTGGPASAGDAVANAVARTNEETAAQARRRPARRPPRMRAQGFGLFGWQTFTASQSFSAILGSDRDSYWGGGVRFIERSGAYMQVDASRFEHTGTRAFVLDGQVFPLGIPTTVAVTPIEVTFGYEFNLRRTPSPPPGRRAPVRAATSGPSRIAPYVGGGLGLVRYAESSSFDTDEEGVSENFKSYLVTGGVHVNVWRWLGTGVDVHYRWVPDALGTAGVSKDFEETDLGGLGVAVRVTFGR